MSPSGCTGRPCVYADAGRQLGDKAEWRLTLSPSNAGLADRKRASAARVRFAASCSRAWRASPIRERAPSSCCLRRKSSGPPIRALPPSSITDISASPGASPRSTRVAIRDRAAVGRMGARALRIWLAQASARRGQRAVARAGQGAGAGFHRPQALAARTCLAAGDRRPPGDLLAFQFGAHSRQRRAGSLREFPARAHLAAPLSLGRAIATRPTACRASSR